MKHLFFCPKCRTTYSRETDNPYDIYTCPECNTDFQYAGISHDAWNAMSKEEQNEFKDRILFEYTLPQTIYAQRSSNDLHTIRNILITFLIIFILSVIIVFVVLLNAY